MTQSRSDAFDWSANRGQTPTVSTGPSTDHTTGTGMRKIVLKRKNLKYFNLKLNQ